ncbi:hypothetical protein [Floricoccus penangensis]|uniref:hypothetical protein n=1 Tax=Floricoccus penangensis TaxID=1859475 RepID=UPI00203A9043|nr:hypothetical protein [Floricoccus penangensis]URZ88171.1 hypothetical protein KIW23_03810 [Floricoccus penangensis]
MLKYVVNPEVDVVKREHGIIDSPGFNIMGSGQPNKILRFLTVLADFTRPVYNISLEKNGLFFVRLTKVFKWENVRVHPSREAFLLPYEQFQKVKLISQFGNYSLKFNLKDSKGNKKVQFANKVCEKRAVEELVNMFGENKGYLTHQKSNPILFE